MFERSSTLASKNHNSCLSFNTKIHQNQSPYNQKYELQNDSNQLRRKVHQLMIENYELKDQVEKYRRENKIVEEESVAKRQEMRNLLDEIAGSDELVEFYRRGAEELKAGLERAQEERDCTARENERLREQVKSLLDHNENLETQNRLLCDIKDGYANELTKYKMQLDFQSKNILETTLKNQSFLTQTQNLLQDIAHLQKELSQSRQNLKNYEEYMLQKIQQTRTSKETHSNCFQQIHNLTHKCQKYKRKSICYKNERNSLALQIEKANNEIDSNTLRKYFNQHEQ